MRMSQDQKQENQEPFMKFTIVATVRSLFSLFRFTIWYLLALALVFLLLPEAALFLQARYEGLHVTTRVFVGGVLLIATVAAVVHLYRSRRVTAAPDAPESESRRS